MILETALRLMRAYSNCPKCGKTMMIDEFKQNQNKAEIQCKCGWKLEITESE